MDAGNGVIAEDVFELAEQVAMVVHPGDVVLLKVSNLSMEGFKWMRDALDHLEGKTGLTFVILNDDVGISVLRKEAS